MRQITRREAEILFLTAKVISSYIEQDKKEMRILMKLSDNRDFIVKYNTHDHIKSYFLQELRM